MSPAMGLARPPRKWTDASTLSHIVGRQVELQRLISEKADISELTVNAIKEDMRASISRYLDGDDAALYMDLMMDLLSYVPNTSKIMCYK